MLNRIIEFIIYVFAYLWFRITLFFNWFKANIKKPKIHFVIGMFSLLIYHLLLKSDLENKGYILSGFMYGVPIILFGRGVVRFFGYCLIIYQYIVLFVTC